MELIPSETWTVYDSTKVRCAAGCLRAYFFEFVLGWRPSRPSIHLEFGKAWHEAMAILMSSMKQSGCYTASAIGTAIQVFRDSCERAQIDELSDGPKNTVNGVEALLLYTQRYKADHFDIAFIEYPTTVLLDEETPFFVKADTVCMDAEGPFCIEHKTASKEEGKNGELCWRLSTQVGAQLQLLQTYFSSQGIELPCRILMNIMIFRNPPKLKKDGDPYASSSKGNEPVRYFLDKSEDAMEGWLSRTLSWINLIRWNHKMLLECDKPSLPAMQSFSQNERSCYMCRYLDLCVAWPNPLRQVENGPPVGFKLEHWDPRKHEVLE